MRLDTQRLQTLEQVREFLAGSAGIVMEKPDPEPGSAPPRRADVGAPAADVEKPGRGPDSVPGPSFPNPTRDSDG